MKVTVIIPVYNREKTIRRCINSIISQTVQPYEIIVVDDGSTDKSLKIVDEFNYNIKVIKQNHRGAQAARNIGILNAGGDYIAFLDSDDEWMPQMLEISINEISSHKSDCVTYSDCYVYKNQKHRLWKLPECGNSAYSFLLINIGPMFQSMLAKKDIFIKIGLLDENVVAYQEWETAIRLANEVEIVHIKQPLFKYHLHLGETISKDKIKGIKGYTYIVNKHIREIIRLHGFLGLKIHLKKILLLAITIWK